MENYEKIKIVGRGAYGTVYLCRRLVDRKLVIIKQIPVEQMTKEERQAALNEVKVLSMLDHPNIIEYYENFLEDKALMIVMDYAQGGTLFEYLQQRNGQLLEEEQILKFFAQMLLSLQHVHSKQILHRDLKTQNILLDKKREVVKIGDFGISKVLSSKSKAYTVVGTPCYISPELCEGKPYNQKSDIWALGCVLYELASLKRAFEAQTLPALILKIMRGTFAPISEHYSEDLRQFVLSMLHLDPNKRPHINQIMAQPLIVNALMNLYTDFGKLPCIRVNRGLSNMPVSTRGRISRRGSSVSSRGSLVVGSGVDLPPKPPAMSSVFCWGGGVAPPIKLPLPSSDTQIIQVSTGRTQRAAVTKNGRLFVWEATTVGTECSNLPGAVGRSTPMFVPRYLDGQQAVTIKLVSCGDLFTACLTDRGILMTYGSGANGCLGHGNYNDVTQAKIVEKLLGFEVVQVSCGASHVLVVTNEHEVFAWGRGDNGRLGLGTEDSHPYPQQVDYSCPAALPEVDSAEQYEACAVYCGVDCSMLLTKNNKLLCCGSNRQNKLGLDVFSADADSSQVEEVHSFTQVTFPLLAEAAIKEVAMGTSHAAAISVSGQLYTFGSNQFGQLGYSKPRDDRRPQQVIELVDHHISLVSCGDTFTVVVTEEGQVFSWGKGGRGRLGRTEEDAQTPGLVVCKHDEPYIVVSLSSSHGNTLLASKPIQRGESPVH